MEDLIKRLVEAEAANSTALQVHKVQNEVLRRDVDKLLKDVDDVKAATHRIEIMTERRLAVPICSAPNMCLELKASLEKLALTVQALVDYRNETKGSLRIIIIVASGIGAVGGSLLNMAVRHFFP